MAERKPVTFEIPADADRGTCRSCHEPIAWVMMASGKKNPIELATNESHFARCPQAKKWREAKKP